VTAALRTPPAIARQFRKYAAIAVIDWQNELAYRANSLIWIAWSILPSATMMLVWIAAYGRRERIGGMTLSEMITYYLFVTAMTIAITPNHEWETAMAIREGHLTQYLVKPVDYFWFKAVCETAYQAMKTMMGLPGLLLLAWLFREFVQLPRWSLVTGLGLAAACALSFALLMCFKSALAYLAFWFGEIGGVLESFNLVMMFFAGRFVPLTILPDWMRSVGDWLPFQWIYSFPLNLALGKVPDGQLVAGLLHQFAWLVAMYALARFVWNRGLRVYEGFGG